MGYSSAFDDLLAQGRREMDRITGRRPAEVPPAGQDRPLPRQRNHVIEGTAQGIPFRMTLKRPAGTA